MTQPNVVTSRQDPGVLYISVSRADSLNALNLATLHELRSALVAADSDPSVRVIVLTGTGEKSFIAGADILEMKEMDTREAVEFSKLGNEVARLLERASKPTIAAVNGFALGGGCEMATACDFILASESALFGQPEVSLGLIPGFGGTYRLMRHVGLARAKELIFTGKKLKASEAYQLGLVSQVFATSEFREKVQEVAAQISRNSLPALMKCKQLMNEFSESVGLSFKMDAEAHAFGRLFGSQDQIEGLLAFAEMRKPKFEGNS
ncbi:MAG: enoyl-CoA hydratase/isomerase family protein [Bdellovibrionales bacterium]|nr:enoyl-CoA hydratase/isomerase family protein [Bdellovibrionales bacterium]